MFRGSRTQGTYLEALGKQHGVQSAKCEAGHASRRYSLALRAAGSSIGQSGIPFKISAFPGDLKGAQGLVSSTLVLFIVLLLFTINIVRRRQSQDPYRSTPPRCLANM